MLVQFVQFESALSEEDVLAVARERLADFRKVPGLVQKFYLKLDKPNHFGGFYIWESREALMAYRDSDLAKSIPEAYQVAGAPQVNVHELLFPLHELGAVRASVAAS